MTDSDSRLIDSFVAHEWASAADLGPYMTQGWRELLVDRALSGVAAKEGTRYSTLRCPALYTDTLGKGAKATWNGGSAGRSYESLAGDLLESNYERVVLGYEDGLLGTAFPNYFVSRTVASAANDWTIDRWLERDERLYGLVLVAPSLPGDAASEIRRVGGHARMVGVAMGASYFGTALGHPIYHPIYAAAEEQGLPIVLNIVADGAGAAVTPPVAGGLPGTYSEYRILSVQPTITNVASLIVQGIFELFPNLRLVLCGGGITWVPSLLWRLDWAYKRDVSAAPWLRSLPSEYFARHVYLTTYGLEKVPAPEHLAAFLATSPWLKSQLMYASGWPAAERGTPSGTVDRLPPEWRSNVRYGNALSVFRWPDQARPDRIEPTLQPSLLGSFT